MIVLKYLLVIIVAYLCGNFNGSILISKLKKEDVRSFGSGNPGTMNMLRNYGIPLGLLTLFLDALKAVIACLFGWFVLGEPWHLGGDKIGLYVAGIAVIIGHIFPVFMRFKGGKGVACAIGVCLVLNPILTICSFLAGVIFILIVKIGSLTSFFIISIPMITQAVLEGIRGNIVNCVLIVVMFLIILIAHHTNIKKLFKGKENKIYFFGKNKSSNHRKIKDQISGVTIDYNGNTADKDITITSTDVTIDSDDKNNDDSIVSDTEQDK